MFWTMLLIVQFGDCGRQPGHDMMISNYYNPFNEIDLTQCIYGTDVVYGTDPGFNLFLFKFHGLVPRTA